MDAITMQAGTMRMPAVAARSARRARRDTAARGSIVAVALVISSLALLVAMLPGLAHVQSTNAEPRALTAPTVRSSVTTTSAEGSVILGTIAEPGPHPTR